MPDYLPVFTSSEGEVETLRAYQAVLDRWPCPYTELDVPTRFGQTHVTASGPETAPAVVFLHAYFATAMSWYRTVGALNQSYRTYAVDVLGDANKSRPVRPVTSPEDFLQWFTDLVDGLGIEEFCLVGNSFGAFMAAYCAMQLPERVRRLVLIGPAATFHGIRPFYTHMFVPKALYLFFPWLPGQPRVMRRSVDWMRVGLPSEHLWEELFYLVMMHGNTRVQLFPRVYKAAELAQIQAPTLLLLGDREKVYSASPEKVSARAKRLMPGIQVEIIPGAHHITALAQPDLVNASLLRFFQDGESE
jgi:pimeloyl-ACP methyl ester carboxylesterase